MIKPMTKTKKAINHARKSEYQNPTSIFFGAPISPINATSGGKATKNICMRTYANGMREFKNMMPLNTETITVMKNIINSIDTLSDVNILDSPFFLH